MSIKPFLGLVLLPLAARRQWRAFIVAASTCVICFSVGVAALGLTSLFGWMRAVGSVTWAGHLLNGSILGFLDRLFRNTPLPVWQLAPFMPAPHWIQPLWLLAASTALGLLVWQIYAARNTSSQFLHEVTGIDRDFALSLSTALLITPFAWVYYNFFIVGPFMSLFTNCDWRNRSRAHWPIVVIAVLCFALDPSTLTSRQPNGWATLTIGSAYFWALFTLWVWVVLDYTGTHQFRSSDAGTN